MATIREKHYINLTNGIEAIPSLEDEGIVNYAFIRIQSSQCEAKNWLKVLDGLDNDLLMSCALGYKCYVYDFSQRKESPRALFQGLALVKYVLNRRWFGIIPEKVMIKEEKLDTTQYFDSVYKQLFVLSQNKEKSDMKRKIDYYKKFLLATQVELIGVADKTEHDSDNQYYKEILQAA